MEPLTVRVRHLYPALLNIAGDRGNVIALQRRCAWRGLRARVTDVTVGETPDFTAFALILFHGGQDKEMDIAARSRHGGAALAWRRCATPPRSAPTRWRCTWRCAPRGG